MPNTLSPGAPFPSLTLSRLGGGGITLGAGGAQLLVIYRGQHCPKCKDYLAGLEELRTGFANAGITVVVASADSSAQAKQFLDEIGYGGLAAFGMTIPQMQSLGLYLSDPRDPPETDHVFPEPGLFYVDDAGVLSLVDISSAPFLRPDLQSVLDGIIFTRSKGFPIRGRHGL